MSQVKETSQLEQLMEVQRLLTLFLQNQAISGMQIDLDNGRVMVSYHASTKWEAWTYIPRSIEVSPGMFASGSLLVGTKEDNQGIPVYGICPYCSCIFQVTDEMYTHFYHTMEAHVLADHLKYHRNCTIPFRDGGTVLICDECRTFISCVVKRS